MWCRLCNYTYFCIKMYIQTGGQPVVLSSLKHFQNFDVMNTSAPGFTSNPTITIRLRCITTWIFKVWSRTRFLWILWNSFIRKIDLLMVLFPFLYLCLWTPKKRQHLSSFAFNSACPSNLIQSLSVLVCATQCVSGFFNFSPWDLRGSELVCVWWTCFNYWLVTKLQLRPLLFSPFPYDSTYDNA